MNVLKTEFEFTLPRGYVDADGTLHKTGTMRLAREPVEIGGLLADATELFAEHGFSDAITQALADPAYAVRWLVWHVCRSLASGPLRRLKTAGMAAFSGMPSWIQSLRTVIGKRLLHLEIPKPHWQEGFFDDAGRRPVAGFLCGAC